MALIKGALKWVALFLLKAYQVVLSPMMGNCCRFHPTCSHYASEAIQRHGILRGGKLTLKRLGRCHPFSKTAGDDPVPELLMKKE